MPQSRRVPGRVQQIANKILDRIPDERRIKKIWKPRKDEGFIDYSTNMQFVFAEVLSRIANNFYIGGRSVYSHSVTTFELEGIPEDELSQFGFGISTELDTRNSQFAPIKAALYFLQAA